MTDLERVREALRTDEIDCAKDPVACIHADAQADLDAHLKEDAEREAKRIAYRNRAVDDYAALKAELAELREQLREAGPAQQALYRSIQVRDQQTHELTRLRETNQRLNRRIGELERAVRVAEHKAKEQVDLCPYRAQRDTLLAAAKEHVCDDGRAYLDTAISEVEGQKGGPSAQGR